MAHLTNEQQLIMTAGGKTVDTQTGEIIVAGQPEQQTSQALAVQPAASPLDLPISLFKDALERRKTNRQALLEWIKSALVEGVDYGRIHSVGKNKCPYAAQGKAHECSDPKHWSKPSLWKPGAEKISGMLGVTVSYPTLHDYEQAALQGLEIKNIIIRCELCDASGRAVANGVGARSLAQDSGDLNKALKMAEKSAHIDATLRMAGLSEVFTQDLEDMATQDQSRAAGNNSQTRLNNKTIGKQSWEHRQIETRVKELCLNRSRVKDWCGRKWGVHHFPDLTEEQYRELLARLPSFAVKAETEEARAEREAIQAKSQTA